MSGAVDKKVELVDKKAVRKEIIFLVIPIIMESILSILAGIVSTALVGRLSPLAISAQGVAFRITDLIAVLWGGLRIGAMVYIAKLYGEGKFTESKQAFQNIAGFTVLLGVVFQAILIFVPMPLLMFFTNDVEILASARSYMTIVAIGFPFLIFTRLNASAFQGYGDTKTPMLLQLLINVVNISAGYLLIFVLKMDLIGAGWATVLSQFAGAAAGLYLMYRKNGLFKDAKGSVSWRFKDPASIRDSYATGIPAALEAGFWQMSAIIMSKVILSYGQNAFAAYSLSTQAETITELPVIGFTVAATTLAAKAYGKKDGPLFREYYRQQCQLNSLISLVGTLLMILLPGAFMILVTDKPELQQIGSLYLIIMGLIQIPQNVQRTFKGTLYAVGYKRVPMYISGFGIWLVRIPLALGAAYYFHWDLVSIWIIIALDQVLRCVITMIFIKRKKVMQSVELLREKEEASDNIHIAGAAAE